MRRPRPPVSRARIGLHLCLLLATAGLFAGCQATIPSSNGGSVSMTQCRQWDDAFIWTFNISLIVVLAAPLILTPFLGLLGRWFWFFTAPYKRIIGVTAGITSLAILLVPLGPWTTGLGAGVLTNVSPSYFLCADQRFGAAGLLLGWIAPDQAALSLWPFMIVFLLVAGILGSLLSVGLQTLLARFFGMRRKLGKETSS